MEGDEFDFGDINHPTPSLPNTIPPSTHSSLILEDEFIAFTSPQPPSDTFSFHPSPQPHGGGEQRKTENTIYNTNSLAAEQPPAPSPLHHPLFSLDPADDDVEDEGEGEGEGEGEEGGYGGEGSDKGKRRSEGGRPLGDVTSPSPPFLRSSSAPSPPSPSLPLHPPNDSSFNDDSFNINIDNEPFNGPLNNGVPNNNSFNNNSFNNNSFNDDPFNNNSFNDDPFNNNSFNNDPFNNGVYNNGGVNGAGEESYNEEEEEEGTIEGEMRRRNERRRGGILMGLFLASFSASFADASFYSSLSSLSSSLSSSSFFSLSLSASIYSLGIAMAGLVWLMMCRLYDPKYLLFLSLFFAASIALIATLSDVIWQLLLARFFLSLFFSALYISSLILIWSLFDPFNRQKYLYYFTIIPFVGAMMGYQMGGIITQRVGWEWTLAATFAISLLSSLLNLFTLLSTASLPLSPSPSPSPFTIDDEGEEGDEGNEVDEGDDRSREEGEGGEEESGWKRGYRWVRERVMGGIKVEALKEFAYPIHLIFANSTVSLLMLAQSIYRGIFSLMLLVLSLSLPSLFDAFSPTQLGFLLLLISLFSLIAFIFGDYFYQFYSETLSKVFGVYLYHFALFCSVFLLLLFPFLISYHIAYSLIICSLYISLGEFTFPPLFNYFILPFFAESDYPSVFTSSLVFTSFSIFFIQTIGMLLIDWIGLKLTFGLFTFLLTVAAIPLFYIYKQNLNPSLLHNSAVMRSLINNAEDDDGDDIFFS